METKLLFLSALCLLIGLFAGAYIERSKSMIYVHETIKRNEVQEYEYIFSNFMSRPHQYGVYIRDLVGGRPPISIIVGEDDRILNLAPLLY